MQTTPTTSWTFPTPDTEIDTLREAKNEFILWPRQDITLNGHVPAPIEHTLAPVEEECVPLSLERSLALPPPSPEPPLALQPPSTELAHAPTAPEQQTSCASTHDGFAPSVVS